MVFSSNIFLFFFLPVFLAAYFLTPAKFRNYTLLLFSIVFYAFGAPDFVFLLIGECIVNYYLVRAMAKARPGAGKKALCAVSVILSLGLLLYFKYANFLVQNLSILAGWLGLKQLSAFNSQLSAIALPIGISFFTFQSLTYTLDVYRGVTPPSGKLSDYVLYIMMFPQLIAGPIVNYNSVAAQLVSRQSSMEDRVTGYYRFVIGLAKKVLIANTMAVYADKAFALGAGELATSSAWIGMLAYTFQIYFDFSGYSDMAIGLGKMMGFRFPENFNNPYTSKSVTEFWKRWHMTLGNFIMNYLYIPLGGNRKGTGRTYLNLWLCFLLSGLWHGASWNFVVWGAFHGLFICADKLFLNKVLKKIGNLSSVLFTFLVVNLGWVLFRADDIVSACSFYRALFGFNGSHVVYGDLLFWFTFGVAVVFSFLTLTRVGQRLQEKVFADHCPTRRSWVLFALSLVLLLLSAGALCVTDFNPFIYFRF